MSATPWSLAAARSSAGRARGFTLIEMVAVVAIFGVLAMAARPLLEVQQRRAKELELRAALRSLRGALDDHKRAYDEGRIERTEGASGYPPRLEALVEGLPDLRAEPPGRRIYFLRRLPRDPFADPELPAAQTWALRSYDSPADAPKPGRDVFDVASRSQRLALDGTPYAQW